MSGKVRQRTAANTADSTSLSVNEKILKECHTLYIDPDNGKNIFSATTWPYFYQNFH